MADYTRAALTLAIAALLLCSAVACREVGPPVPALPSPVQDQEIAFASTRDGQWDIYLVRLDGSLFLNLTRAPGSDGAVGPFLESQQMLPTGFSWSPDGDTLAYSSEPPSDQVPYVCSVKSNGSGQKCLFASELIPQQAAFPAWSPDGKQVAIAVSGSHSNIALVDSGLASIALLTQVNEGSISLPAWSPDGDRIAFLLWALSAGDENGIGLVDPDGNNLVWVTDQAWSEIQPAPSLPGWEFSRDRRQVAAPSWSPDGEWVAFTAYDSTGVQIFRVRSDGTELVRLTQEGGDYPQWSPDGRQILFASLRDDPNSRCDNRTCNYELYVMDVDGGSVRRLTDSPGQDLYPAWSPDGAYIAFVSTRDGNWEIYVMAMDGSGEVNVTNDPAQDAFPAWRPRRP